MRVAQGIVRGGGGGTLLCALLVVSLLVPAASEPAVSGDVAWLEDLESGSAHGSGAGADSSPVHSAPSGQSGRMHLDDTDTPAGGDEDAVDCNEIDLTADSELGELLGCSSESPDGGNDSASSGVLGAQALSSASECGTVDLEYLGQQFLRVRWGFIPVNARVYVVRLTCEDGSPAENIPTGMEIDGPISILRLCTERTSAGRVRFTQSSVGRCRSYVVGDPPWAGLIHAHSVTNADDLQFRRLVFWADLNSNGRHDPGEPYDLAFSPDDNASTALRVGETEGLSVVRGGSRAYGSLTLENELGNPVDDTRIGMDVVLGPSSGSALICIGSPAPDTVTGGGGDMSD